MAAETIQTEHGNEQPSTEEPVALESEESGGTAEHHEERKGDDRKRRINKILTYGVPVLVLALVVTDNLQPGDWRTAEHLQGFAKQAAAGGGAPPEQAAQASRLAGTFIKQQVLTLTVADGFYFIGEAMVVCLILVAVLRAMPLAVPAEGQ